MNILDTIPNRVVFRQTGTPVEPEFRPLWRISLIALILLKLSAGNKAGVKKIQVLSSLVSSHEKRKNYFSEFQDLFSAVNVRFDPLVDRAINIGLGEGIFELEPSKSIKLSTRGLAFAKSIDSDEEVFAEEKEFMQNFSKPFFTDTIIDKLISGDLREQA
ncbi:hypothetical protein [Pseudomonas aeruginosa]|uniref:hypothetical protein n=1 Tax=Pseudomonas aeruginosa TaxID=287 RepID=UPI0021F1D927|nr:hypothetical protein [Pseudomonas aeruginosa]MCO1669130.1 hypothetical protein [Pseudomonas aeruginosa]MCO1767483.1 hypothetical protein [Pseudomonas aeruginosa]MCV4111488.1 hypothetical protein [Pseudomonas aeruginosa]MCV4246536.1 hypothetical protein [Pseudomonas aeruginosa]MCV4254870.1 hypothetical protein [Pseudomonas aeruginosa]